MRIIQTLDPSRLCQSDFVDFSNLRKPLVNGPLSGDSRTRLSFPPGDDLKGPHPPFPPDTCGFLYFLPAPHESVQLASEVRFRITGSNDPSSFVAGNDLLLPDFTPWRIPLVTLARSKQYLHLEHLLLRDGLTTRSLLGHCAALTCSIHPSARLIHSLGQLFSLNFDYQFFQFHFASASSLHYMRVSFFEDHRGTYQTAKSRTPYAGKYYMS